MFLYSCKLQSAFLKQEKKKAMLSCQSDTRVVHLLHTFFFFVDVNLSNFMNRFLWVVRLLLDSYFERKKKFNSRLRPTSFRRSLPCNVPKHYIAYYNKKENMRFCFLFTSFKMYLVCMPFLFPFFFSCLFYQSVFIKVQIQCCFILCLFLTALTIREM